MWVEQKNCTKEAPASEQESSKSDLRLKKGSNKR